MKRVCLLRCLLLSLLWCPASLVADSPAAFAPASLKQASLEQAALEPAISDRFMDTFMRLYEADPGALGRYTNALRAVSPEQLQRAVESLDTTAYSYLHPMVLTVDALPALADMAFERLSVMAVRGGKLKPVPFQFDEYDSEGLIWIEGVSRHPADGRPGHFDALDELVFMFRDGGRERYDPAHHGELPGTLLHEVRLTSPRNEDRFVYVVQDNAERSDARYVSIDLDKGELRTTVMTLDFNPKNLANIQRVTARVGKQADENVFDNLHLALSTGILNRNLRINLDTRKNIRAAPLGVKAGPVRASVLLRARIWYLGMPTLFSHPLTVQFYEQGAVAPLPLAVSSLGAVKYLISLLRDPQLLLTVDFHQLEGAITTFDAAWHERLHGIVDGDMSLFEHSMNLHRMPGDWLMLDSTRGWTLFFVNGVPITEGGLFDAFLEGSDIAMLYLDDARASTDYQQFSGASPRLGFRANGLPQPALDLLAVAPKTPRHVSTLGEAMLHMEKIGRDGGLQAYDEVVNRILRQLRDSGRYTSVEALTDAYLHDASRLHYTGIPAPVLRDIFRAAMLRTMTDPGELDHGALLTAMKEEAEARHIHLADLRHASMHLTLWFPNGPGPGGPRDFHWQAQHPPQAEVRTLTAPAARL